MADSSGEKRPKARQAGSSGQRRVPGAHTGALEASAGDECEARAPPSVPRASRAPESPPHRPLQSRPLSQAPAEHPKESASRELDLVRSPRRMKCCLEPQQS